MCWCGVRIAQKHHKKFVVKKIKNKFKMQLEAVLEFSQNIHCLTGVLIHAWSLYGLSKKKLERWALWPQSVSARCLLLVLWMLQCHNFATVVSGLSLKQYHINLLSSQLRQLMLATQESEKRGHLSSWGGGSWEIGRLYFKYFFPRG